MKWNWFDHILCNFCEEILLTLNMKKINSSVISKVALKILRGKIFWVISNLKNGKIVQCGTTVSWTRISIFLSVGKIMAMTVRILKVYII